MDQRRMNIIIRKIVEETAGFAFELAKARKGKVVKPG